MVLNCFSVDFSDEQAGTHWESEIFHAEWHAEVAMGIEQLNDVFLLWEYNCGAYTLDIVSSLMSTIWVK